jgi:FAD/FMN-containing dehydrogenase
VIPRFDSRVASLSARAARWKPALHEPSRTPLPPDAPALPGHILDGRVRVTSATADALRGGLAGPVLVPGDEAYDAARLPWQRKVDVRPALVAEAAGPADVRAAIRIAREHGLPLAVQATGHGAVATADGGLLLKTTPMSAVEVDPERQVARIGGGAVWSDVIAAAAPHGLAPLSGSSAAVSVTGYTLGGGSGWLSRLYGYAADSVLRAQVVTADGELRTAAPDEHPDLYWALRGGGGNFGVVTELEFRLYPVTRAYGGMAMFDVDRAAQTLALYREWALDEPDESNTAVLVAQMPPAPQIPEPVRGRRVLVLRTLYAGDAEDGERLLAPLLEAAGPPLMGGMQAMSFAEAAVMLPPPPPNVSEGSFDLFHELPDAVLDAVVEADGAVSGIELRHWGGAMARPEAHAGPVGHRDVPFSVMVAAQVPDRDQAPAARAAVDAVAERLRPHATGGSFLNFLGDPARTATAYTPQDHRRLAEVKRTYDPDNFFSANLNIPPTG